MSQVKARFYRRCSGTPLHLVRHFADIKASYRMVELRSGSVEVDEVNIRDIRLETLRQRLALVPQDSTLFLGTLRENL